MKNAVLGAAVVLAVATIGVVSPPVSAQQSAPNAAPNTTPLSFGMDVQRATQALGTTLIYVRGRPGDEMFLAQPNVKGSALSHRHDGLYLQFRRGRLAGWKGDWGENRPCCN